MKPARVGVVMVVQNDAETVERAILSFYPWVERILVSTDPARGWSGVGITPDGTLARIRALDAGGKISIIEDDFWRFRDPLRNETYQRQYTADQLARAAPGLSWILQVDADEEFLDFPGVLEYLGKLPWHVRCVRWQLISLFRQLDDGRYLVVVESDRRTPICERFYLAHRPRARLIAARLPALLRLPPSRNALRANELLMRWNARLKLIRPVSGTEVPRSLAVLHYSYAKTERRIREKLRTWGHAGDFDGQAFLSMWRESAHSWDSLKDVHPVVPARWPALAAYSLEELKSGRLWGRYETYGASRVGGWNDTG